MKSRSFIHSSDPASSIPFDCAIDESEKEKFAISSQFAKNGNDVEISGDSILFDFSPPEMEGFRSSMIEPFSDRKRFQLAIQKISKDGKFSEKLIASAGEWIGNGVLAIKLSGGELEFAAAARHCSYLLSAIFEDLRIAVSRGGIK